MARNVITGVGYRSTTRAGFGHARAVWAIASSNLRVIFRYWFFWILISVSMLHFLVTFALIYMRSQMSAAENAGFAVRIFEQVTDVTGTGSAYHNFLVRQTESVYILLAYASAVLLATDFQAGGINFYLSKPIGRIHYLLGKILALFIIVGFQTILPALALFIEAALYSSNFEYVKEHTTILVGILGYGAMLMLVPSLLSLAIAILFRKTTPIVVAWIGLLFVLPTFGTLLSFVFNQGDWRLLGLRYDLRILGSNLFGIASATSEERLPYALVIVVSISVICLAVILRRLRPVEVVT